MNQSVSQSVSQSISQSINQSINQSIISKIFHSASLMTTSTEVRSDFILFQRM